GFASQSAAEFLELPAEGELLVIAAAEARPAAARSAQPRFAPTDLDDRFAALKANEPVEHAIGAPTQIRRRQRAARASHHQMRRISDPIRLNPAALDGEHGIHATGQEADDIGGMGAVIDDDAAATHPRIAVPAPAHVGAAGEGILDLDQLADS